MILPIFCEVARAGSPKLQHEVSRKLGSKSICISSLNHHRADDVIFN